MKTAWLLLLATTACAPIIRVGQVTLDPEHLLPFTPSPEYSTWWTEVVILHGRTPVTEFGKLEFWRVDYLACPPRSPDGCAAHGLFIGPKDVILSTADVQSECWVKHEFAHVALGRGDDAHGDPLFTRIRQSCN